MKTYRIAVIGSRETDKETMDEMYMVLFRGFNMLRNKGYLLEYTSGGCWKGPDQLQFMFARQWRETVQLDKRAAILSGDKFVCYLPDDKKMTFLPKLHPNVEFRVIEQTQEYRDIVTGLHPYPDKLQDFAFALHGRNLNIIMGDDLKTPVDAVYYSAPLNKAGKPTGGTAMGVAYAESMGVPTFNHVYDQEKWKESLRLL